MDADARKPIPRAAVLLETYAHCGSFLSGERCDLPPEQTRIDQSGRFRSA